MIEENQINRITERIIGAAIEVHRALGPGLLESTYHACLAYELRQQGLEVEREKELPVVYKGVTLDCGYRIDLLVEHTVIVELKAVQELTAIHEAQILSYYPGTEEAHTNPTRQRGECLRALAGASG